MWQELDTATINSFGPVVKTWTTPETGTGHVNWTVGFRKTQEDSLPEAQTSVIDKDERACVTPKEDYFGQEK